MKKTTKNNIIIGAGVVVLILALFLSGKHAAGNILSADNFISKYKSTPGAVLLDVRTPEEFSAGHISNAVDIDFENPDFEQQVQKLDASKTYFVYCRTGNRSAQAAAIMKRDNFKNLYELQGGITAAPQLLM